MHTKMLLSMLVGFLLFATLGCACQPDTSEIVEPTSTELLDMLDVPPEVKERLDKLNNSGDTEELDVFECPDQYPGRVASGETGGWILTHKRELKRLGVNVRWNCEKMAYEIVTEEQTPLCECQR